jgi:hypothetical protein
MALTHRRPLDLFFGMVGYAVGRVLVSSTTSMRSCQVCSLAVCISRPGGGPCGQCPYPNANPAVAAARLCTIFQMGNLCMAGGSLSTSGGQIVQGNAYRASGVTRSISESTADRKFKRLFTRDGVLPRAPMGQPAARWHAMAHGLDRQQSIHKKRCTQVRDGWHRPLRVTGILDRHEQPGTPIEPQRRMCAV